MTLFAVFDVEAVGLFGDGFACGGVVIDSDSGAELSRLYAACDPIFARGGAPGRKWLEEHLPPMVYVLKSPRGVRTAFWNWWLAAKEQGALLAADVPWPVEARFLLDCINDGIDIAAGPAGIDIRSRDDDGPYPLIDIASVRLAAGLDPLATELRLDAENPPHDPLADARQSARLLYEALQITGCALDSMEAMHAHS